MCVHTTHAHTYAHTTHTLTGGSLDQYGTISEQVLGRIAVGAVRGLSYLSSRKIMHRGVYSTAQYHVSFCLGLQEP